MSRHQIFDLKTRQDEVAYVKDLAHFMLTEPYIKACCACIRDACLANSIKIHESGKLLRPEFSERIRSHFTIFAADAITMFYMCGFVVYYIEMLDGMRLPRTLPLGSFTWGVERMSTTDVIWPFRLRIRGIDCSFDERKLHLFTRDVFSRNVMYSPMEGVMRILGHYISIHESIANSALNNEKANVLVSENIDIKDQTLNGIQMLDDARQYMMKGSTPLQQYDLGVRLAGARTDTVNLERESALQRSNEHQKKNGPDVDTAKQPSHSRAHGLAARRKPQGNIPPVRSRVQRLLRHRSRASFGRERSVGDEADPELALHVRHASRTVTASVRRMFQAELCSGERELVPSEAQR
jgi:hypothetical protein